MALAIPAFLVRVFITDLIKKRSRNKIRYRYSYWYELGYRI